MAGRIYLLNDNSDLMAMEEAPDVTFGENVLTKRARIPFEKLTTDEVLEKLKSVVSWLIEQVNAECGKGG